MFGSAILETLTGMVFIFAMMSLVILTVNEQISSFCKWRAKDLQAGLTSMLDDPKMTEAIYRHPLVYGLWKTKTKMIGQATECRKENAVNCPIERPPSYIPSIQLAKAALDIVRAGAGSSSQEGTGTCPDIQQLRAQIESMPDSQLKDVLKSVCVESCKTIEDMEINLSCWFDSGMERIGGWYRRRMQKISSIIAGLIVIGFNVDCLEMATKLYKDAGLRATLTVHAQSGAMIGNNQKILDSMGALPVGWVIAPWDVLREYSGVVAFVWIASKILGFFISIAAVTLGAPFWFDLLARLMNIRLAGAKPKSMESDTKATATS